MKIFAKRSKKKASPAISAADKAVLELLKKDPKELNAKERRQIKRYQDRIKDDTKTDDEMVECGDTAAEDDDKGIQNNDAEDDIEKNEGSDSDVSEAEDDDVEPSQEEYSERQDKVTATDSGNVASELIDEGAPDIDEDEVKELLEKLNSKNKRKLNRQLERDGNAALKVVREEALKLIEESKTKEVIVVKEKVKEKKPDPEPSSSKKRKRDDWSGLPPEERLRREEQRAKQQEAAERRAKGEIPPTKHKHPLNSERRRANRRKPKWLKKQAENPNEHDISGFHMRKITKKSS